MRWNRLVALTTDAAGQLHVLGHDGDTTSVHGAEVGVLEEADQVSLRGLLQSHDGGGLEAEIGLVVLSDLADQTLERSLLEEKVGGLLVAADLTKSHGARAVAAGLLLALASRGGLAGSLGGQLLARGLATGGLAGGLLGAGHDYKLCVSGRIRNKLVISYVYLRARIVQNVFGP